ncbi:TPA: hypothetical protein J1275_002374 [Escherichia coli]|nr:hypothetical protein [Escherichia coli]HBA6856647.1 hypothetical protein [Escherichia coli]HBA8712796.1 hypothetical protein [Escherichia coli]HBA8941862.1 hypothetical protein [Escherichia coli]HBA8960439.1 hypothetical protein [Escherichia coli]
MKTKVCSLIVLSMVSFGGFSKFVEAKEQSDGITIQNYNLIKKEALDGGREQNLILNSSMQAMWEGIVYTNALAKMKSGGTLICTGDEVNNGKDLSMVVEKYIKKHPERVNLNDRFALIAILALNEFYPCRK